MIALPIVMRARRGIALLIAANALVLAATPWLGIVGGDIDIVAAAFPLAPLLAILAIGMARRSLRRVSSLAALAALVLAAAGWWIEVGVPRPSSPSGARLIVVTHNVAVANRDPAATAVALAATDADVLLLQETDGAFLPHIDRLRARFPYGSACAKRCSAAILSRWPTDRVRYRLRDAKGKPIGPPLFQTIVHAPAPVGDVLVASLHLPRSIPADRRAERRRSLARAIRRVGDRSTIVGGDFNLVPWSPAMRWLDRELAPLRRASRADFSFPRPFPIVPIDHVFAGPGWMISGASRLPATGSDHYPVCVELVWQGG